MFLIPGIGLFGVIYDSLEHGMTSPHQVRYNVLEGRRSGNPATGKEGSTSSYLAVK